MSRIIRISAVEFFVLKRLGKALAIIQNDGFYSRARNGATCQAKTRSGNPCKNRSLYPNGRCKFHGGLSTGPKTLEGKRRSALNTGKTYEELLERAH